MSKPKKRKKKSVKAWAVIIRGKAWVAPNIFKTKPFAQDYCWKGEEVRKVTITWEE